jgi:hypothetical protein
MRLRAYVVRLAVDATAYTVHAAFDRNGADGDWQTLTDWIAGFER